MVTMSRRGRPIRSLTQALLEDSRVGQGVFRLAGLDPAKVEQAIKVRACGCLRPACAARVSHGIISAPCRWHM